MLNMKSKANIKVQKLAALLRALKHCLPLQTSNHFNSSQAKGLAKSGLKNLLMHRVGQCWCIWSNWYTFCCSFTLLCLCVCVCVYNVGPQRTKLSSERRIGVTPPCSIRLPAEPSSNHATLWDGEIVSKQLQLNLKCVFTLEDHPHHHRICYSTILLLSAILTAPCGFLGPHLLLQHVMQFGGISCRSALLPFAASCQPRPRRPAHKHRSPSGGMKDSVDAWSGWVKETPRRGKRWKT